jgi:SecD/SecF fusion protein
VGFPFEIDQVFVAAILTIIGYSINDTVIIYDRIREQLSFGSKGDRKQIFNDALNITLSRTLITSGTTLFVVVVLLLFGGEVLRGFSFALFVGIVVGTYSSIFIAAPVVLDMDVQQESGERSDAKPVMAKAGKGK